MLQTTLENKECSKCFHSDNKKNYEKQHNYIYWLNLYVHNV